MREPAHTAAPEGPDGPSREDATQAAATAVYLLAVRQSVVTRASLIEAGVSPDAVEGALEVLLDHGLLTPTGEDAWAATPPESTPPPEAAAPGTQPGDLRAVAEALGHLHHEHRPTVEGTTCGIRILTSLDHLITATLTALTTATSEVWCARDHSPSTERLFRAALDEHRRRLISRAGTPVRRHAVFDPRVMSIACAADVLMARAEAGEDHRFITGVPFGLLVADSSLAVVDLTAFDTSGAGSLLVTDRRLVLALRRLVQTWWNLGTPTALPGPDGIDRDSAYILSMLATGATDATVAARSGLSQRTIERRVSALMQQLGAATRFQAGVLAARRGWI